MTSETISGCVHLSTLKRLCFICMLAAATAFMAGCGGAKDSTPPFVQDVSPLNGAPGVSPTTVVTITFSEAMNAGTIDETSFTVSGVTGVVTYDGGTYTATFTPDDPLDWLTPYTVTVTTAVTDTAGNPIQTDFTSIFTTEPDTYAPGVVSVSPQHTATDVPAGTTITITFDEDMAPATINGSSFTVGGVSGTVGYDPGSFTATFTPDAPLDWLTPYTATVSTAVTDLAGNPIAADEVWSFTIEADTYAPNVIDTLPLPSATDVAVDTVIYADFDEPMNSATITTSSFTVSGVTGSVSYSAGMRRAYFTPSTLLPYDTTFTVTLTTAVEDANTNALAADYVWTFTTQIDSVPPTVEYMNPVDGAYLVSTDAAVTVKFDEAMDPGTINASSFTFSPGASTVAYDAGTFTASNTPDAALSNVSSYTSAITTGITDAQGLPLASGKSVTFKTANVPAKISGTSNAFKGRPSIAYNSTGDALAAWSVHTGTATKVVYSYYSSSGGFWSAEATLADYPDSYLTSTRLYVYSNGTDFIVLYYTTNPYRTYAAIYDGSSWDGPTVLMNDYLGFPDFATNGTGFGVLVRSNAGNSPVYAAIYDGSSWDIDQLAPSNNRAAIASDGSGYMVILPSSRNVTSRTYDGADWNNAGYAYYRLTGSGYTADLGLVSNGTTYAMCCSYNEGFHRYVDVNVYSASAWDTSTQIMHTYEGPYPDPLIATNGSQYAVTYNSGLIYARTYNGSSWSGASDLSSATGASTERPFELVSNGSDYCLSWQGDSTLYVNTSSGASWNASVTLDNSGNYQRPLNFGSEQMLVADGSEFLATWNRDDGTGPFSARGTGVSWSASTIAATSDTDYFPWAAADPTGGFTVAWLSGTNAVLRRTYSGAWGSTATLSTGTHNGTAQNAHFAVTSAGAALVAWEQRSGAETRIHTRYYNGSSWGTVALISNDGTRPRVASNGTSFVVIWESDQDIYARRFNIAGDTWNSTATLHAEVNGSIDPDIASNGTGYEAVWGYYSGPTLYGASSADGNTWSPAAQISSNSVDDDPIIVSNGSGYLVCYNLNSSTTLRAIVHNGASWGSATFIGTLDSAYSPRSVASNGTGYAIAWPVSSDRAYCRIYNGASWDTATEVSNYAFSGTPYVASNGSDYAVFYGRYNSTDVCIHSGGVWGPVIDLREPGTGPVASHGSGYAALHTEDDGAFMSIASHFLNTAGEWGSSAGYLEGLDGDCENPQILANGINYFTVWTRYNPATAAKEIWGIMDN